MSPRPASSWKSETMPVSLRWAMIARAASGPEPGKEASRRLVRDFSSRPLRSTRPRARSAWPSSPRRASMILLASASWASSRSSGLVALLPADSRARIWNSRPVLPDLLDLALAQADRLEEVPDLALVRGVLHHDPEKRAFPEIDAELEALEDGDVEDAGQHDDGRDGQGDVLVFQEPDVGGLEELHVRYSASWRIS